MSAGIRAKIMKKFTKIATAIVAGCAIMGVTTGGAILLDDDNRDIIVNVETTPQEEPQEPEIPIGEEVTPKQPQEDENPTGEENPEEKTIPGDNISEEGDENPEDISQDIPTEEETPSEEENPENPNEEIQMGYITVEVRLYNRYSYKYSKSDIKDLEGTGEISVYNIYENIKLEYPERKEYASPSKSLGEYLEFSDDKTVDLIIYLY